MGKLTYQELQRDQGLLKTPERLDKPEQFNETYSIEMSPNKDLFKFDGNPASHRKYQTAKPADSLLSDDIIIPFSDIV